MKTSLLDISLSELRDFIVFCDSTYKTSLSKMSLVSLKLRLQFIIHQNHFTDLSIFRNYLINTPSFRENFFGNLIAKPNEIYRDAEQWEDLCKNIASLSTEKPIEIFILEFGDYSDTTSLLISLYRHKLAEKCHITILRNNMDKIHGFRFSKKDLEAAELNFKLLHAQESLFDYFKVVEDFYHFAFSDHFNLLHLNLLDLYAIDATCDVLIARNYTPHLNFSEHENVFNSYLKILRPNAFLFAGSRESFKNCVNASCISNIAKDIPIYKKTNERY